MCIINTKYSEKTIRNKARQAGYTISKGFVHWLTPEYPVWSNAMGERDIGYNVTDDTTGFLVWGCHDSNFDHLFNLQDVEDFLKEVYEEYGLEY